MKDKKRPMDGDMDDHHHEDLLNENLGAIIENPLAHISEDDLLRDVQNFAQRMDLTEILPGLRRAVLVAKNLMVYDDVCRDRIEGTQLPVQLTSEEKEALKNEQDHLFVQSKGLYMTIVTVSIAGVLQGWVQSSINGATMFFPEVYHLDGTLGDWITGITNAAPFLFGALLGCPLVDPVNHQIGRRGTIFTAAILILASSLGSAGANTWYELFVCRIFNGIGMGLKASSTPILASETAVAFWRGSAALCWQLWVAFGIALGFAANLVLNRASSHWSMRLQLGAPVVPALVLILSLHWCPESPRWHMMKKDPSNYRKAYNIFVALRSTELQAQRDLYVVHKQIELETTYTTRVYDSEIGDLHGIHRALAHIGGYGNRFAQLFRIKRLRNVLVAACIVNLAQQLCGINVLAFYSGTLFRDASGPSAGTKGFNKAFLYSFGFGAINFVFGLPAVRNIDTLGRRVLLLATLPLMSISLLAAAFSFHIPSEETSHIALITTFLFVQGKKNVNIFERVDAKLIKFAALYSPGMGPMPFTIASESFPLSHREAGVAVSVGLNLFFAGVLTVFYPPLHSALDDTGSLCLFAGLSIVEAILIFLFLPETKQRSLEELDLVFAVPMKTFVGYECRTVIPWFLKRYLLFRDVKVRDLYDERFWDTSTAQIEPMEQEDHHAMGKDLELRSVRTRPRVGQQSMPLGSARADQDLVPEQPAPDLWPDPSGPFGTGHMLKAVDTVSMKSAGTYD